MQCRRSVLANKQESGGAQMPGVPADGEWEHRHRLRNTGEGNTDGFGQARPGESTIIQQSDALCSISTRSDARL